MSLNQRDPRKHTIPPAPPEDAPEQYECKPYWQQGGCKPPTIGDGAGWLAQCEYLPNDHLWVWRCGHGRPFYLQWQPAITTAEFMDMIDLTGSTP